MSENQSANFPLLVSRNAAGRAVWDALALYVGRGRRYSVKQIQHATGVPDRRIECAMCDPESADFRPLSPEHLLSISLFLGELFSSEWMAKARQGCFALPDADDTPPGAIVADDAEDHAKLTDAARDGTFANDGAVLKVVSTRMISRGIKLRSMAV